MAPKIGGLWVNRKPGEMVSLFFGKDQKPKILRFDYIDKDGVAWISFDGERYDMIPGESVRIGNDAFYLDSIEGGRVSIRFVFSDSVKIIRSELLGGVGGDGNGKNSGEARTGSGRVREHKGKS